IISTSRGTSTLRTRRSCSATVARSLNTGTMTDNRAYSSLSPISPASGWTSAMGARSLIGRTPPGGPVAIVAAGQSGRGDHWGRAGGGDLGGQEGGRRHQAVAEG